MNEYKTRKKKKKMRKKKLPKCTPGILLKQKKISLEEMKMFMHKNNVKEKQRKRKTTLNNKAE